MRVYDKGAQIGSIPDTWIRFEAEIKGDRAAAMTRAFLGDQPWDALAWGYAAGAVPELRRSDPDLYDRVFLRPALSEPVETQFAALDDWIESFRKQYGGRIRSLADLCNLSALEVVEMLGLCDTKPLERTDRHGAFFRAAVQRLSDIMVRHGNEEECNEETNANEGAAAARDGDEASRNPSHATQHRLAQRTEHRGRGLS